MIDSNLPVTTKQAMPFDSLLGQSRDLVCERLAQALDGMLDKVDGTLSALINETQDRDMRKLYLEAKDKALAQRKPIAELFGTQYLKEFQVRSNRMKKTGQSFSDFDSSSLELDLVGEDDLNETLKVNDMATKLRQYCDEELVALDQRIGVLLGDANLEAEDNPFSPQAICDAFKHTCRSVASNVNVRMVLLKLFDDHVLDDIRSIYKAVNALLVQNSILPKIRFSVSRGKEGSKAPSPGARAGEQPPVAVAHAADRVPGDGPDFFSVLQDLIASNVRAMTQPGATGGTGGPAPGVPAIPGFPPIAGTPGSAAADGAPLVVLQGAELMNLLTRVQHGDVTAVTGGGPPLVASAGEPGTANVLRELKATSLGTGMNQLDSMTLDIVAMLFDQLFDDPKIPISVKGLIGRMQIPMLKVALADKAFFSRKTLGEISSRLPADFNASNPLFGRLEALIQELMDSSQDNIEIFDVVRERLQILVEEEDRRIAQETQSAAKRIELNESLAASKTMAEFEVKTRVQGGNLPRPVIEFLVHQWVKPLLIVHVRRGQHSDAWKNSLATMDLLIWSVEAKHTSEERGKLATVVPDLLKRLAAGLKIADVEDAIRERFFSDLNKLHTEAMSMDREGHVAAAHDASAAIDSANLDIAPALKPLPAPDAAMPLPALDATMPLPVPDATMPLPALDATMPLPVPDATMPLPALDATMPLPALDAIKPVQAPEATKPLPALDAIKPVQTPGATRPVPAAGATKSAAAPATTSATTPLIKSAAAPATTSAATPLIKPAVAPATKPAAAPAIKPVPKPKETVQPIPATAGKAPAARIEAQGADSDSLDFTKILTIKNPFGGGQVHVKELESADVRAAGAPRAKGEANDVEFINNLKKGTWVEFREKDAEHTHRPAKLSYISPLKSSFLFVDRMGKTVKECSRSELGRLIRLGMVVIVDVVTDEAPLFDRMMAGVIGKLS